MSDVVRSSLVASTTGKMPSHHWALAGMVAAPCFRREWSPGKARSFGKGRAFDFRAPDGPAPDSRGLDRGGKLPPVTRETLPRFDLYGELEVSPFASEGTIEAAFRSLVKRHHPDLESGNESRMRRLNLAREWLTDPELRHRYDQETDRGQHIPEARRPVATHSVVTRSFAERRAASGWSPPAAGAASRDSEASFGIHADEVRQFLAELRSLDRARAQRVWNGRAVAHTRGYTDALRAAASAAKMDRRAEWQFAREAAAVITRGKLGDSTLTEQVADVLSDVAGAIAIRDLLSPAEYSL